jgi:hypothetical protein
MTVLWMWLAVGFLHGLVFRAESEATARSWNAPLRLGIVELGIPLALLNLLFLSFILVQLQYLFGSDSTIHATPGLTYSEYARRGFFELVAVAALTLPLLLGLHWLLHDDPFSERIFRVLAGVQIVLVGIIMCSGLWRMNLYMRAYGLTHDRFYATAFMLWLGVLLAWLAWTVLRGKRDRFAFGALVAGFAAIAVLNVVNPDAIIARVNLARTESRHFDPRHIASLSADALPVVLAGMSGLDPSARQALHEALTKEWGAPADPDNRAEAARLGTPGSDIRSGWRYAGADGRSWNWGRHRAESAWQRYVSEAP